MSCHSRKCNDERPKESMHCNYMGRPGSSLLSPPLQCQQQPQLHGFQVCITKQSWPNRVWFSEASGLWEVLLLGQAILFP